MITSKTEYKHYLEQDKRALGVEESALKAYFAGDYIWKFQKKLRKLEYFKNCKKGLFNKAYYKFLRLRFRRYSLRLGFSIPENVFGPGLAIVHYGTIVVSEHATIGKNCRIHAGANIGASGGTSHAPRLGDAVYIGPGAKLFGAITIADNCAIGANAVVTKSFNEPGQLIAGNPAKALKEIDITTIIKN